MQLKVSPAEILDRWTILELKKEHILQEQAQLSIRRQLNELAAVWASANLPSRETLPPYSRLQEVNRELWETEDALRAHESRQEFDDTFIALARSVYRLNDARSEAKRALNTLLRFDQDEWKSYGE